MTTDEFNEKYKDYLEEGHYGLDISIPEVTNKLDEIFQGLIKIPGFKYHQIKSKFGTSRFYTNLTEVLNVELDRAISHSVEEGIDFYLKLEDVLQKRKENGK
jgi:hypothetical protein